MNRDRRQDPPGERPSGHQTQAAHPMRVLMPLLLAAVLVAIAVAGYWLKRPGEAVAIDCADPLAGCAFNHRGASASVLFSSPPAPLEAFGLRVTAPGARKISAEFQMLGMDMGFNRYDLRPDANGAFTSNVTLPVCVSGRHDWRLFLDVDGTRYALPFRTQ